MKAIARVIGKIDVSKEPIAIFGIGIPGSGKSTILSRLSSIYETDTVEVDALRNRMMISGWYPGLLDDLENNVHREASAHIFSKGMALIDDNYCEAEKRLQDIDIYRSIGARSIGGVWMDTPLELAIERDANRPQSARVGRQTIEVMSNNLNAQLPSASEGFDWIVRITPED